VVDMTNYDTLSGRTAVVTGASSGIGEATARLLAANGAKVALLSRRADRLTDLAAKIVADGGQALAVAVDVADAASVAAGAAAVREAFGRVDLVVNNAGVMLPNPITDVRADEWARMIDINLTGAVRVIGEFAPDLIAAAAEGGAADLIDISSVAAHLVFPTFAVYGATKAALTHLSANLRAELGPQDVRVTNVEPGLVDTELREHMDYAQATELVDGLFESMGSLHPGDLADLIAYVASRPRHVNLGQVVILPTRQA
jgi:NADP-dependent 3-hydroxy acid dehydrogenase YdfG